MKRCGMVQVKAQLLVNRRIARDHFLMRLKAPAVARRATPGQFMHVRCGEEGRGQSPSGTGRGQSPSGTVPLLRRPLSILDANPEAGTIDLIYKVVGLGTRVLSQIPVGAQVDLLGPLGHPFEAPPTLRTAILVGGGVGIPPLYFLAKWLVEQCQVKAFLGARTKEWVICRDPFRKLGVDVHVATDDGTLGHRGSVIELLKRFLRATDDARRTTVLYICGPTPMMAAAATWARQKGLPAQVSLEERMGCAMGCCLGCVVEISTEPAASHSRFQRVCTEGPVFPAEAILWK